MGRNRKDHGVLSTYSGTIDRANTHPPKKGSGKRTVGEKGRGEIKRAPLARKSDVKEILVGLLLGSKIQTSLKIAFREEKWQNSGCRETEASTGREG